MVAWRAAPASPAKQMRFRSPIVGTIQSYLRPRAAGANRPLLAWIGLPDAPSYQQRHASSSRGEAGADDVTAASRHRRPQDPTLLGGQSRLRGCPRWPGLRAPAQADSTVAILGSPDSVELSSMVSTVKKSHARTPCAWARRNVLQLIPVHRGAGSRPGGSPRPLRRDRDAETPQLADRVSAISVHKSILPPSSHARRRVSQWQVSARHSNSSYFSV